LKHCINYQLGQETLVASLQHCIQYAQFPALRLCLLAVWR
jgi:hypothetical protein